MHFRNLAILTPEGLFGASSVKVQDEYITSIQPGPVLNDIPDGYLLLPGLVDLHGDMIERELEPRPNSRFPVHLALHELDKRHAASGVTTAFLALSFADFTERSDNLRLVSRMREVTEVMASERPNLACDTRLHARFEITAIEAVVFLESLIRNAQVDLISLMDHTPGQGQFRDLEGYVQYMMNWLNVDRQAAQRELERNMLQPKAWHVVKGLCQLARHHSIPLASHDDDTTEKVQLMHSLGVQISEFPVSSQALSAAKSFQMTTLMGAPNALRGRSHSGNLSAREALGWGHLDILASDYYPATMIHAVFALARQGYDLREVVDLVSYNPAQAVGLADRGSLQVGLRADLVLVTTNPLNVIATYRGGQLIYASKHVDHRVFQPGLQLPVGWFGR